MLRKIELHHLMHLGLYTGYLDSRCSVHIYVNTVEIAWYITYVSGSSCMSMVYNN